MMISFSIVGPWYQVVLIISESVGLYIGSKASIELIRVLNSFENLGIPDFSL